MGTETSQQNLHWFDMDGTITEAHRDAAIKKIDHILETMEQPEGRPTFQTDPILFEDDDFAIFKQTFIRSCTSILPTTLKKKNFRISAVASCYMDYWDNYKLKDREAQWHFHDTAYISGIFYLHIPNSMDRSICGTEFRGDPDFHVEPRVNSWLLFPGRTLHRPGVINTNDKRYVLAADLRVMILV